MEIAPGIHKIENVRGCNVYLLAADELVLIDTGLPGNTKAILTYINQIGRDISELSCIIITHSHIDHTGSLHELKRLSGAITVAGRDEVIPTKDGNNVLSIFVDPSFLLLLPLALLLLSIFVRLTDIELPFYLIIALRIVSILVFLIFFRIIRIPQAWVRKMVLLFGKSQKRVINRTVVDGELIELSGGLRIIHTPGHTPGSICILSPHKKVIFVGDTIINNHNRLSRPVPLGADRTRAEKSLQKLADFDFEICCFGHGPPLSSAKSVVDEFIMHPPRTPLFWRIVRNWRRLFGFVIRMFRRN